MPGIQKFALVHDVSLHSVQYKPRVSTSGQLSCASTVQPDRIMKGIMQIATTQVRHLI